MNDILMAHYLHSLGLSASAIGRRLGVSRNTVIGALWRARQPKGSRGTGNSVGRPRNSDTWTEGKLTAPWKDRHKASRETGT